MLTLVLGGSGSGKSAFAEGLVTASGNPRRLYLATMEPFGAEAEARIARHRAMRSAKGFETVERFRDLDTLPPYQGYVVLLEDLGNLCANELYGPDPEGGEARILSGIRRLAADNRLIVVSNAIFSDGVAYGEETRRYLAQMARLHAALAQETQEVVEVVCGLPIYHKGGGPL